MLPKRVCTGNSPQMRYWGGGGLLVGSTICLSIFVGNAENTSSLSAAQLC